MRLKGWPICPLICVLGRKSSNALLIQPQHGAGLFLLQHVKIHFHLCELKYKYIHILVQGGGKAAEALGCQEGGELVACRGGQVNKCGQVN